MPSGDRIRPRAQALLLVAAGAALWSTSFAGVFQFDDFSAILRSGWIDAAPATLAESAQAIRPLTRSTYWVERHLFGADPAGYHFLSVTLHIASTLLVWRIGRRLFEHVPAAAFGAALLFLVHPLATEAVTYLSGRASLLAACLSLLSVERWQSWRERQRQSGAPRAPWSSLLAFALALLAKETAAILPVALLAVDAVARADSRSDTARAPLTARLRLYLPHLTVLAIFLAFAAAHPVYRRLLVHSLALRAPVENLALQPRVAVEAARLFVAPWRSNFDHDLSRAPADRHDALLAFGVALAAAVALRALRRGSPAGFGVVWFLVHLLPTCSLVARNDLLSERNLYLPSAGLCLAAAGLGLGAARLLERVLPRHPMHGAARVAALAVGLVAIVALSHATLARNALYADPVALWRDTVAKSPRKARPHANLGWSLYLAGELDLAIAEFRIALRLAPGDPTTGANLERAWERKRRAATEAPEAHLNAPRKPTAE